MRINIVPVEELADQHLVAEYREIKMLPKALVRSIKSKRGLISTEISKRYTLNKGHGYFFYDKLAYIETRFGELIQEMKNRNFATNAVNLYDENFDYSCIPSGLKNSYKPDTDEINVNRERIKERILQKPMFYKFHRKPFDISKL